MFYKLVKYICYLFLRFIYRWEVEGRENIPEQGPLIVISNHTSLMDPVLVGVALPRTIHYMAKEELFDIPVLKWIIIGLRAFPVRRGVSDRAALKKSLQILNNNEVLGIFPEGKRSLDGSLNPFQGGAAMLSIKTGAPILPVAIIFNKSSFRGSRVKVKFGKPIMVKKDMTSPQRVQDITSEAYKIVADMME